MKNIVFALAFIAVTFTYAQEDRNLTLNKETNLIEVTYFHDNGEVSQTGFYTIEGKLQGEWLSYDLKGKKIVSANYENGKKVGKWFFWKKDMLSEVDYDNNAITSVNEWKNTNSVADNN